MQRVLKDGVPNYDHGYFLGENIRVNKEYFVELPSRQERRTSLHFPRSGSVGEDGRVKLLNWPLFDTFYDSLGDKVWEFDWDMEDDECYTFFVYLFPESFKATGFGVDDRFDIALRYYKRRSVGFINSMEKIRFLKFFDEFVLTVKRTMTEEKLFSHFTGLHRNELVVAGPSDVGGPSIITSLDLLKSEILLNRATSDLSQDILTQGVVDNVVTDGPAKIVISAGQEFPSAKQTVIYPVDQFNDESYMQKVIVRHYISPTYCVVGINPESRETHGFVFPVGMKHKQSMFRAEDYREVFFHYGPQRDILMRFEGDYYLSRRKHVEHGGDVWKIDYEDPELHLYCDMSDEEKAREFLYFSDIEIRGRGIPGEGFVFPLKLSGVEPTGNFEKIGVFWLHQILEFMRECDVRFVPAKDKILVREVVKQIDRLSYEDLFDQSIVYEKIATAAIKECMGPGLKISYYSRDEKWYLCKKRDGDYEDEQWDGLRSQSFASVLGWWLRMSELSDSSGSVTVPICYHSYFGAPVFVPKSLVKTEFPQPNGDGVAEFGSSLHRVSTVPDAVKGALNKVNYFSMVMRLRESPSRQMVQSSELGRVVTLYKGEEEREECQFHYGDGQGEVCTC